VQTVTINDARVFSLRDVQRRDLVRSDGLVVELLCFEAGQRDAERTAPGPSVYQVLEGEAIVRSDASRRLGRGTLLSVPPGVTHTIENAGGGLLVIMATSTTAG
jgi:quercetin dioxygenase-like cupin family protein